MIQKNTRATDDTVVQLLYNKKQAAQMLGISLRTLHTLIVLKELPAKRIGRRVLLPHTALVSFARYDQRFDKKAA